MIPISSQLYYTIITKLEFFKMKLASVLDQPWATHFRLQLLPSTHDHFPYVDKYKVISKRNLYWPIFHPFARLSALISVIYYTFNKTASKHQKHKRPSLALWELMDLVSLIFGKLIGEISKRLKRIIVISRSFKVLAANSSGVLNFSKIYSGSIFDIINIILIWKLLEDPLKPRYLRWTYSQEETDRASKILKLNQNLLNIFSILTKPIEK